MSCRLVRPLSLRQVTQLDINFLINCRPFSRKYPAWMMELWLICVPWCLFCEWKWLIMDDERGWFCGMRIGCLTENSILAFFRRPPTRMKPCESNWGDNSDSLILSDSNFWAWRVDMMDEKCCSCAHLTNRDVASLEVISKQRGAREVPLFWRT